MFQFKTLQRQLLISLLLPVGLLLLGVGFLGFLYARQNLLQEWQEAAVLRLERAAHHLDMRLTLPPPWMRSFSQVAPGPQRQEMQAYVLGQLRRLPGVNQVKLVWQGGAEQEFLPTGTALPLPPKAALVADLSSPRFLYAKGQEALTIEADLLDRSGQTLGQLQVGVRFQYLMADVLSFGWAQSYMACLVDSKGQYLAHTDPQMKGMTSLGESHDPLDKAVLQEMQTKSSGTVLGPGSPPPQVIGFYRLHTAPWVILLYARGEQILEPIVRFRLIYFAAGAVCLVLIMLLMRLGVSPVVRAIRHLSRRAGEVAQGVYGEPLNTPRRDEIGQLIRSFNTMTEGLKERDLIQNTFGRYVNPEIARKLLKRPQARLLGGDKREVAILFADLRGFTPIAEGLSPEATIHLLNRFFSRMVDIIQAHEGIIEDFLGDAILAFFDPLEGPLSPAVGQAYRCSLEMQGAMAEVNRETASLGLPSLAMGIGLHAGPVVVGNIGSETRTKYGIVGAAVNVSHRIQAEARGGEVVMSASAYDKLPQSPAGVEKFTTHLKGLQDPLVLCLVRKPQGT
jgi:class 3 adenylate cyclase